MSLERLEDIPARRAVEERDAELHPAPNDPNLARVDQKRVKLGLDGMASGLRYFEGKGSQRRGARGEGKSAGYQPMRKSPSEL